MFRDDEDLVRVSCKPRMRCEGKVLVGVYCWHHDLGYTLVRDERRRRGRTVTSSEARYVGCRGTGMGR